MNDPFNFNPFDPASSPPAEVQFERAEVRKQVPKAVQAAARRAESMIIKIAMGDRAGAEALVTDEDRARRPTGREGQRE